jgi:hypothetical protein
MIKIIKKMNSGYTLLEMVFYLAIFSVFSITIINTIIVMTKSSREIKTQTELMEGGIIMERISREIKKACDIDSLPAIDNLKIKIGTCSAPTITEFKKETVGENTNITISEDGSTAANLNSSNIDITGLTFTQITTAQGKAIKIVLTIKSKKSSNPDTIFNNTAVLRGSYK